MIKAIYIIVIVFVVIKIVKAITKNTHAEGITVDKDIIDVFFRVCSLTQQKLNESKGETELYMKGIIFGMYTASNILLGTSFKQGEEMFDEEGNKNVEF